MKKLVNLLKETPGLKEIVKSQSLHQRMPTKTDFKEGLYAINRLQSTYRLDPAEMANGLLGGKQYRLVTVIYLINIILYNFSYYYFIEAKHGVHWNA